MTSRSEPETRPAGLTCMEVWGGNRSTRRHFSLQGLDVWISAEAQGPGDRGGDVYFVSSCATGRIVRLLLADVSGHGAAVDGLAGELRRLMQRHVNCIDQRRLVREMNRAFTDLPRNGLYATAVAASCFLPTGTLTLTNAGHPPPLLYRARRKQWSFPVGPQPPGQSNLPLGILRESDYGQATLRLCPRDLVLCYTDALIESRGRNGGRLGCEGLLELVRELDPGRPDRLPEALRERLGALHPDNLATDDLTMLLFTPREVAGMAAWRASIGTHLAALRRIGRALVTRGQPVPWPDLHPANICGGLLPSFNRLWGRGVAGGDGSGEEPS